MCILVHWKVCCGTMAGMIKVNDVVVWRPFKDKHPNIAYHEWGIITGIVCETQVNMRPLWNEVGKRTVLVRNLKVYDTIQDLVDLADPEERELPNA